MGCRAGSRRRRGPQASCGAKRARRAGRPLGNWAGFSGRSRSGKPRLSKAFQGPDAEIQPSQCSLDELAYGRHDRFGTVVLLALSGESQESDTGPYLEDTCSHSLRSVVP